MCSSDLRMGDGKADRPQGRYGEHGAADAGEKHKDAGRGEGLKPWKVIAHDEGLCPAAMPIGLAGECAEMM